MIPILRTWILAAITSLQPTAPWDSTYSNTAEAIAEASAEHPLWGDESEFDTAAVLVAFAYTESRFNPLAEGDCFDGKCHSFGLFQINPSHSQGERGSLFEPRSAALLALQLLQTSMRVCRARPAEERFAWYAAGGNGCKESGWGKSRARWRIARELLEPTLSEED